MQLNSMKGPCIIISASGMCEAGRVLHHLKNNVESEHNTILIVGFQAQHTLGRRIVERRPEGEDPRRRARSLRAGGGHERLLRARRQERPHAYAHAAEGARRIFLIHGEPDQQEPLRDQLNGEGLHVVIPSAGDVEQLD